MMNTGGRTKTWVLFGILFVVSLFLVHDLRPKHDELMEAAAPKGVEEENVGHDTGAFRNTPLGAMLPIMLGFREVLASLMWVQADDLFHRGEYGPILGLVRRIALIDPNNLDVYATGAWHMAYNFMDRRLIDDGVDFLKSGVANNPQVYDLFFEMGYMHYDKTKDFNQAVLAYGEGAKRGTTTGKREAPAYVRHQLAHALGRIGPYELRTGSPAPPSNASRQSPRQWIRRDQ